MTAFVLIHGAYQGGWIWQPVARLLRAAGQTVYAPSLDGCAERRGALRPGITTGTHGAEIADLLFFEDLHDVVLVGTSAGGMVLCRAAELARERVGRVVFVDALALRNGERIGDFVNRSAAVATALATGPSPEDARDRMFRDLAPEAKAFALARYTPHPIAAMDQPVELASFWDQPWQATVIRCLRAVNPPEAHQRRTADALKASYLELDTGHYPMLSEPDALARMILG
ncbi:MAG: alpha/beta fold hydrolase [Alphaproteobacteria bacterium]|nr:alpha/beta fold hydrolase [Alphaproteobacteria bacterium]